MSSSQPACSEQLLCLLAHRAVPVARAGQQRREENKLGGGRFELLQRSNQQNIILLELTKQTGINQSFVPNIKYNAKCFNRNCSLEVSHIAFFYLDGRNRGEGREHFI